MKTKIFMTIAAAATLLSACNKDNEMETPWNGEIRLTTATADMDVQSRAAQDLQLTKFDKGTKVSVFINEQDGGIFATYAQPLTYTAYDKGVLAPSMPPYFPQNGNGVEIYACYPQSAATAVDTPEDFTIVTDQSDNAAYMSSDLMLGLPAGNPVARTKDAVALTFTHELSKINIQLLASSGLTSYDLDGAVVKLKNIKPTISFDPKTGITGDAKGTAIDITVMTARTAILNGSAIIIPQAVAQDAAFIEVTLKNGCKLTHKLAAATTYAAKTKYSYVIVVKLTGLTVNSIITDWFPVGPVNGEATM